MSHGISGAVSGERRWNVSPSLIGWERAGVRIRVSAESERQSNLIPHYTIDLTNSECRFERPTSTCLRCFPRPVNNFATKLPP